MSGGKQIFNGRNMEVEWKAVLVIKLAMFDLKTSSEQNMMKAADTVNIHVSEILRAIIFYKIVL